MSVRFTPAGLEADLGPADPADDRADLVGERLAEGLSPGGSASAIPSSQRGAGGAGLGDDQVPLVELGDELAAEPQRHGDARREAGQRRRARPPPGAAATSLRTGS